MKKLINLEDAIRIVNDINTWSSGWRDYAILNLQSLPVAHPEPLTDAEQRIFLAAMAREENVCKDVDDKYSYCREPYEVNLVSTCHEIIRKVKGALWH